MSAPDSDSISDTTAHAVVVQCPCSAFSGPRVCQHCGYYAQVRRRTVNQGWHVAEWGECRKADLTKTGVMTGENETCDAFTPDPRRWPNGKDEP